MTSAEDASLVEAAAAAGLEPVDFIRSALFDEIQRQAELAEERRTAGPVAALDELFERYARP